MANSFKTRTKYSVSTNYFLQEDGNFWMLEDGTGTTASPTTTHGGKISTEETSNTTFYQCPDSTTTIVLSISLINKHTESVSCAVYLNTSTSVTKLVDTVSVTETNDNITLFHNVPIPINTTLEIMSGQKITLQQKDALILKANNSNAIDISMSFMEIT